MQFKQEKMQLRYKVKNVICGLSCVSYMIGTLSLLSLVNNVNLFFFCTSSGYKTLKTFYGNQMNV